MYLAIFLFKTSFEEVQIKLNHSSALVGLRVQYVKSRILAQSLMCIYPFYAILIQYIYWPEKVPDFRLRCTICKF